ncbi:MAG: hypothetical protein ABJG15_04510 [Hyphomonadaceae bacterium]
MTSTPLADDIAFVRQIAEEGQATPSLSGRFALMWGILTGLALTIQWLTLRGQFFFSVEYIGAVWMAVGVVGGISSGFLGWSLRNKPGQSSAGNQAEQAAWPISGLGLFVYAISIAVAVVVREQPVILFDTIMPLAFLVYAINQAMAARLFRRKQLNVLSWLSIGFSVITAALVGTVDVYLVAAIGVVVIQVLPGIAALRNEPSTIV